VTSIRRRLLAALAVVAGGAAAAGCGGSDSGAGGSTGGTGSDTITVETQPSPLESGRRATVTIRIKDAGGQPLGGARVNFKAQHRTMNHGADADRAAEEREPGVYGVTFLPSMAGSYRMTVSVDGPKGRSQATVHTEVR
jgi:hypothetical protein